MIKYVGKIFYQSDFGGGEIFFMPDIVYIPDIVDTLIASPNFNILVTAVKAAGLVETLKTPGPFTVFAPTDEAFARLPEGTVDNLLKDIPRLKTILTYHVIAGKVLASDVTKMKAAKTIEGEDIKIDAKAWHLHRVKVNDAEIIESDIMADNGVIHIINRVLMPPIAMEH
jgi:uncharacterized surface protein with fasciclin (FAS1) repeats